MNATRIFKSMLLLLLVFCLIFSTISCGDSENDSQDATSENGDTTDTKAPSNDDETQSESEEGSESANDTQETELPDTTISENIFTLFKSGKYTCPIIRADIANDVEIEFYNNLRSRLKELTGVTVEYASDFISYNADPEARNRPAILVGYTNFSESQEVYKNLAYGESIAQLVGNKIVIAFSDSGDADKILNDFLYLLKTESESESEEEKKTEIQIPLSNLPIRNKPNSILTSFPVLTGTVANYSDCGDNTHMIRIPDADMDDFRSYKQLLLDDGYELTNERTAAGNSFVTYVKNEFYMYIYYRKDSKSIRVIRGASKNLPDYEAEKTVTNKITEPTLTMFNQLKSALGLGMIYKLPDGRFVIFDGGDNYTIDTLYPFLKSQSTDGNITVAAWFLSHAHNDHQGMFTKTVNLHSDVKIETIIHNYAARETYLDIGEDNNTLMQALRNLINKKLPDTKIIKAHTGQVFSFGGCEFEILFTPEDFAPEKLQMFNDTSLVVRANFEGKSILMLADATYRLGSMLVNMYGDYLKSDMVQLAHHGIWASNPRLYDYIQAEVLFWPTNSSNAQERLTEEANAAAINHALDIYVSGYNNVTITFPYTIQNNKEEFLAAHPPLPETTETDSSATDTSATVEEST